MVLLEELTRLNEERDGGALHETGLRERLEHLVIGEPPAEARGLEAELRKLRYETALMRLDREYEAIRQECLMYYRGTFHEPTLNEFWGLVVLGIGFSLVLLNAVAKVRSEVGGPLWMLILAVACGFAIWIGRGAVEVYRKWNRLEDAGYDRQRAREMLEQSRAGLVEAGAGVS